MKVHTSSSAYARQNGKPVMGALTPNRPTKPM